LYTALAGGVLACLVAARRQQFHEAVSRTTALIRTAGANDGEIEHAAVDNRFAYAPAIAIGTLVAALTL
jgi:hypothetical protein